MKAPGLLMLRATIIALLVAAAMIWLIGDGAYVWMKALHIIAIISWMAGLLYLPRLFVYHCEAEAGSPQAETFKVMERRLLKAIMTPAMIASWAVGLWLAWDLNLFGDLWFQLKLFLALTLTWVHWFLANAVKEFAEDSNRRPQRFYRFINEAPTLLMIGIVILVIVRPF
jgi:putative membrane protein